MMTDTTALAHRRRRAQAQALFLHAAAADELEDRMAMVNKPFNSVAIVTGMSAFWSGRFPEAHVVADAEMLTLDPGLSLLATGLYRENYAVGVVMLLLLLLNDWRASRGATWHMETLAAHRVARPILIALLITLTILLGNFNTQEFIYFDF